MADYDRSDILIGPPSRVEFNGQDLLPTVGTALIVVAANACYVQVELACNRLETRCLLFPGILDWVGEDQDCLAIKETGNTPVRDWLVLEGPAADGLVRQYSFSRSARTLFRLCLWCLGFSLTTEIGDLTIRYTPHLFLSRYTDALSVPQPPR